MPTPLGGGHYHHQHQDRLDRSTDLGFLDTHHEEGEAHYRAIILPPLTMAEALKTTRIHSVAGLTGDRTALVTPRPCRAPHHTISDVGLIAGGHLPMPGEVTLAHNGVLFLDELPEFCRHVLEVLRQPLEESLLFIISRASWILVHS
jgi:magnesium chelatase family protein